MKVTRELNELLHDPAIDVIDLCVPTPAHVKLATLALKAFPTVNAQIDGDAIVYKHYVNLGIAAATPRGLLVPNIKDAQDLSMRDLARALEKLTLTAREGRTAPADQQGGTIRPLLDKTGVAVATLRTRLGGALDRLPKVEGTPGEVGLSNDLARLLNVTDKLAQQRGDQFISSELFLLALFSEKLVHIHFREV